MCYPGSERSFCGIKMRLALLPTSETVKRSIVRQVTLLLLCFNRSPRKRGKSIFSEVRLALRIHNTYLIITKNYDNANSTQRWSASFVVSLSSTKVGNRLDATE